MSITAESFVIVLPGLSSLSFGQLELNLARALQAQQIRVVALVK